MTIGYLNQARGDLLPFPIIKFHSIRLRSLQRKEGGVRGDEASIRLEEVSPSLPLNLF